MATKTREILMAIRELNFKEMEQKAELDRQRAALELEFSRKRDSLITRIMSEKIEEQEDEYIEIDEVATMTGIKKATIYQYTSKMEMPFCKVGKQLKFRRSEIKKWMNGEWVSDHARKASEYVANKRR